MGNLEKFLRALGPHLQQEREALGHPEGSRLAVTTLVLKDEPRRVITFESGLDIHPLPSRRDTVQILETPDGKPFVVHAGPVRLGPITKRDPHDPTPKSK